MTLDTETQLLLLDPSLFMARPARAPPQPLSPVPEPRAESGALQFSPATSTPELGTPTLHSEPEPPAMEDDSNIGDFVLLAPRKLSTAVRTRLLAALASCAGGDVRSQSSFDARVPGDRILGRLDGKTLVLEFHGRGARRRWLSGLREIASGFGFIEPD